MMSFQGPLICHALVTPEALLVTCNIIIINVLSCLVTQMLYFSQFFSKFFCRFMQNFFMCKCT